MKIAIYEVRFTRYKFCPRALLPYTLVPYAFRSLQLYSAHYKITFLCKTNRIKARTKPERTQFYNPPARILPKPAKKLPEENQLPDGPGFSMLLPRRCHTTDKMEFFGKQTNEKIN